MPSALFVSSGRRTQDCTSTISFKNSAVADKSARPTPLSVVSQPQTPANAPPPNAPAMRIMTRRAARGSRGGSANNTGASSTAVSNTASEIGFGDESEDGFNDVRSPADSLSGKDKATLTREQREARYKETRERIFKGFEETGNSEVNPDEPLNISRTSSSSGKKKNRKQRPNNDDFEARSQFAPYYSGTTYNQTPFSAAPGKDGSMYGQYQNTGVHAPSQQMQYDELQQQQNYGYPQYSGAMDSIPQYAPPMASPQMQMYGQKEWMAGQTNPGMMPSPYGVPVQGMPMRSQQSSAKSSPLVGHNIPASSPYQAQQGWGFTSYQTPYLQAGPQANPQNQQWQQPFTPQMTNSNHVQYQYGQLPNQSYSPAANYMTSQHPIPGSYNRPAFNPQTRSFVPSTGMSPRSSATYGQAPPPPQAATQGSQFVPPGTGGQGVWPQPGAVPNNFPQFLSSLPHPYPSHDSKNRQASNGNASRSSNSASAMQPTEDDSIAKWGKPAHLPPKPPPSEIPSAFEHGGSVSLPVIHPGARLGP